MPLLKLIYKNKGFNEVYKLCSRWPPLTQSAPEDKIIYDIRIASFLLRRSPYLWAPWNNMVMSFCVFFHLWGKASQEERSWWKAHCLGHYCQCLGSTLQGALCGKQLQTVLWLSQTGSVSSQTGVSRGNTIRCLKLPPFRGALHTPALTCLWKSCSHERREGHGDISLGTCDWKGTEERGCWGDGWDIFSEGGTPQWRATFHRQPTVGKVHSWGTAAVSRDILENLYSWVPPIRLRTLVRLRVPLGVVAIANPCWGRWKNHQQVKRRRQKPLSTQPKTFWATHFLI